jgi:hypothetical protein
MPWAASVRHDEAVGDDAQPEIRIGDRERREVDARLQQAHADGVLTLAEYDERAGLCWAARTRGDLDRLTRDLPPAASPPALSSAPEPKPQPSRSPAPAGRTGPVHRALRGLAGVALVGAALYGGGSVLTADDGASVFGSREVQVAGTQDEVQVGALFGGVTVRVPDDVRVRTTGTMIFGSIECGAACQLGGPNQREVVVDANGGFGSVEVLRQNEQPGDRDNDDQDDD